MSDEVGYEEYREQWVETCEALGLTYRETDARKFTRDAGWIAPASSAASGADGGAGRG